MQRFDAPAAVKAAGLPANQAKVVRDGLAELIATYKQAGGYDPEEHGYVVLVERGDDEKLKELLGVPPAKAHYEGARLEHGCFRTAVVYDDYGLVLVVPDEPWLVPGLRLALEGAAEIAGAH